MVVKVNTLDSELEDWVSQSEAARLRGTSRQAVRRLVERGRLTVLEIGGRKLVNRLEVMSFDPMPAGRKPKE